jgi:hypothetical protein
MNNKVIVASLSKIANELDSLGKFDEANEVTSVMVRLSDIGGGSGAISSDSANYKGLMTLIVQQLESGNTPAATDTYLRGLKTLQSDDSKAKFSKQWNRVIAKYRDKPTQKPTQKPSNVPGGLFPPAQNPNIPIGVDPNNIPGGGGTTPFEPPMDNVPGGPKSVKPATGGQTGPESDKQLNRWVNKAENIYKAWSTKPAASRSNTDAVGLIADIDLYLQEMQFRVPSGSPMHSLINSKRRIVQKMMSDISSGTPMGAGYTPTPYSKVTGYPAKDVSPFGTGKRLTGPKLTNQADKEIKGI